MSTDHKTLELARDYHRLKLKLKRDMAHKFRMKEIFRTEIMSKNKMETIFRSGMKYDVRHF